MINLIQERQYVVLQALAVSDSSAAQSLKDAGISDSNERAAQQLIISTETQGIRYRFDGDAPTSSAGTGIPLAAGGVVTIVGNRNINNFKWIETTAGAKVFIKVMG